MVSEMTASIDDFCADGFLVLRGAVAPDTVRACVDVIENALRARAVDPRDPFRSSGHVASALGSVRRAPRTRLLGSGEGVGGTLAVRFPSMKDPGDAGWHIDGSYDVDGKWWVNMHSRRRGLLALFLFTDVGDADAPTEILLSLA